MSASPATSTLSSSSLSPNVRQKNDGAVARKFQLHSDVITCHALLFSFSHPPIHLTGINVQAHLVLIPFLHSRPFIRHEEARNLRGNISDGSDSLEVTKNKKNFTEEFRGG